ncbi:MAG: C39 family peptidase [Candidatus Portnoybacteria bacterium]|nr:C39 family peptidase [Candidatus Portnoybacteria bacterium]
MIKKIIFFLVFLVIAIGATRFLLSEIGKYNTEERDTLLNKIIYFQRPTKLILDVPFINEAPDGNFSGNWKNACEEASMTMVEKYYLGEKFVSIKEAMDAMQKLFSYEDRVYGSNADSDAQRTMEIINNNLNYTATIIENPTIEQIKKQIQKKRPVITLHYGFELHNLNIPFAVYGSYYHQMVVIGYDDATKEFIVHDDGDQKYGANHRYGYDLFMGSLHDFDYSTRKTNLPARVIFTSPK